MKKLITSSLPDVLMVMGTSAISYGAWSIYAPVGWIIAGGFLLAGGILAARAGK